MMDTNIHDPAVAPIRMFSAPSHPSSEGTLSVKVVESVASYEGVDTAALPPLAETINPDALNSLFHPIDNPSDTDAHALFEYSGHTVRVHADRSVTID